MSPLNKVKQKAKMKKNILVIIGTTRQNRAGENVANWALKNLPESKNINYELVDLRDWALPFFDEGMPPMASQGNYQNELGQKWITKVNDADGILIVTGEYNHSVPAVLKNAMDYWYIGTMMRKPISFVTYGASLGGARAAAHLRQISLSLGLIALHHEVNIANIWEAFDESGAVKNEQHLAKLQAVGQEIDNWFTSMK